MEYGPQIPAAQNADALSVLLGNMTAGTLTGNRLLFVPAGQYDITEIDYANSLSNVVLRGEGRYSSRFNWVGGNAVPMFKLTNARWCGFESLSLINATANIPSYGVQFDRASGQVGSGAPTGCFMRDVFIGGSASDVIGKAIGYTASLNTNNDAGFFENIEILNCQTGYSFDHSNSLLHRIIGGDVSNCSVAAFNTYQGDGTTSGGSFVAVGVLTGGNATILQLGPSGGRPIALIGHQSEGDTLFSTCPTPVTANGGIKLQIMGGEFVNSGAFNLAFDCNSNAGFLQIAGAFVSSGGTLNIPTSGPRVVITGGFCKFSTISYNSYVRIIDAMTDAGTPTYTNLGSGILRLDHSGGTSQINTTPITTANATSLAVDGLAGDSILLNNGSATNLATLTAGYVGQVVSIETFNSNTTLKQTAAAAVNTFRLKGGIDVTPSAFQIVTLRLVQDGGSGVLVWHEISRNF